MKKKVIGVVLSVVTAASLLAGCGTQKETASDEAQKTEAQETEVNSGKKVVIGYVDSGSSFPNEGLSVAIDQGFLEEELSAVGYEVETVPFTGAGPAINEALVNGSIDIATTGDVPAIVGKSNGVDTVLLAGEIHTNDAALAVPAASDIQTVADLKGKTVATLQGSYMHKVLINMLEANGLSFSDVQFTSMTSGDAAAALEAGSVDAAVVANTQEAALANSENVRIILTCAENESWKGGHALVGRSQFVKENRAAAVALVKAYKRSNEFAKANREEAIKSLAKSGVSSASFEYLYPEEVNFNISGGTDVIEAYDEIKQFLLDNELIKNDFDISQWIDTTIFEEAK